MKSSPKRAPSHNLFRKFLKNTPSSPPSPNAVPVCQEINQSKFPLFCFILMLSLPFVLVFISSTHASGSRILAPLESYKIPLASEFCEGITVTAETSWAQLYVFASEPPLTEVTSDQFNRSFVLSPLAYKNWYWSLFVNSHILLYICATPNTSFMVIRGDENFTSWKSDPKAYDPANFFSSSVITSSCTYHSRQRKYNYNFLFTLNITNSNSYYFIFANQDEYNNSAINFTAFLDRRGYDTTTGYLRSCEARSTCSLDLNYGTHEVAIVKTPEYYLEKKKKKDQTTGIVIDYSCNWRPSVYMSVIGGIFGGSLIFTLFCLYCIRPRLGKVIRGAQSLLPSSVSEETKKGAIDISPSKNSSVNNCTSNEISNPLIYSNHPTATTSSSSSSVTTTVPSPTPNTQKSFGKVQYQSLSTQEYNIFGSEENQSPTKTGGNHVRLSESV